MRGMHILATAAAAALAGCNVAPEYVRPEAPLPAAYRELQGWKSAEPRDHHPRGEWWRLFADPVLDGLVAQVSVSNQTLAQAQAQYRQAAAAAQAARAGFFPSLNASLGATRSRASSTTAAQPSATPSSRGVVESYGLRLDSSWEADLWGRVQRAVDAGTAGAQASAALVESARLSAQAALAQNYFQLRTIDAQARLLEEIIAGYQRSYELTQNQYRAGLVARADTVQATVQLRTAQAQRIDLGAQRAQLEHAIAVLVGRPPSEVSIAPSADEIRPPAIPVGVPSELLERRADVAAAERRVAAANAQIGVARAAFFPALTISAAGGFQSARVSQWFTVPSRFWSLGPALALSVFDGGLRRAQGEQALAAYDAAVAAYRQTVLGGIQEVEDSLSTLRILEEEAKVQAEAVEAAKLSLELSLNQYKAGLISYLQVVTSQTAALASLRGATDILARRMAASVQLVKALGGDWSAAGLPGPEEINAVRPVAR
ncbi:MAG: efflux transporter outer membrane subunit [Burkholderiales bacterium]|nr:efflux transporter outer membrane subunit [Burkholderiales bacterium]